jgi:hypothetical protein
MIVSGPEEHTWSPASSPLNGIALSEITPDELAHRPGSRSRW